MIAKWRREARPSQVTQRTHGAKNNAENDTTSPTRRISVVDDEEPQLVLPLMSEEERQRAFDRAHYKIRSAARGKILTNAGIEAWEQEYSDNLFQITLAAGRERT
jgi:hypothetical protein